MHDPTFRIAHNTAFVTPVMEHWLEREIEHNGSTMKDQSDNPLHHERTLLPRSYIRLPRTKDVSSTANRSDNSVQWAKVINLAPGKVNVYFCLIESLEYIDIFFYICPFQSVSTG